MSSPPADENAVRQLIENARDPLNSLRHLHDAIEVVTAEEVQRNLRAYVMGTREPLDTLDDLRVATESVTKKEVRHARKIGAPWTDIAKRLGLARPTTITRYGH